MKLLDFYQFYFMRKTFFKIRSISNNRNIQSQKKITQEDQDITSNLPHASQNNLIQQFMGLLKQFVSTAAQKKGKEKPYESYLQSRDKKILIQLPQIISTKLEKDQLKKWITQVVQTVSSAAFHFYFKGEMTFEQTKIFCSQNIMKNIINLSLQYPLSAEQFQMLDDHIQKKSLNYVNKKYPLKDSLSVSRKLQKMVQQVDKLESIENNQIVNNQLNFEFRESGNYNDLIMKMLNILILKINHSDDKDIQTQEIYGKNLYVKFQEEMTRIFQKAEDEDWMNHGKENMRETVSMNEMFNESFYSQNQEVKALHQKKEKYRAAVREYSQHHTNRKLSQSVVPFSKKQIENGILQIKNPAILRILTKWCQQLLQQFEIPNYYQNRSLQMMLQNRCQIRTLYPFFRDQLNQQLAKEKINIDEYFKQLKQESIKIQVKLLERQKKLSKEGMYLDELDQFTGKFSINMAKNLHQQVIAQLNRLIHGLMTVSKNFFKQNLDRQNITVEWPYPPNLVTFKIGDLMRCKYSSKQKEVIAIYKQLNRISRDLPHILSIVRIKNRLKKSTNDILINARFHKSILCQIQLSVNSKTSEFIKCSQTFQHFIYQIQRTRFGPMTELCSIRTSFDQRVEIYNELILNQKTIPAIHLCEKTGIKWKMIPWKRAFICSCCNRVYYDNDNAINPRKCNKCDYTICVKCRLNELTLPQIVKTYVKEQKIAQNCKKIVSKQAQLQKLIGEYGLLIPIESKKIQYNLFRIIESKDKYVYMIGKNKKDEYYEIANISTPEIRQKLLNQNIIILLSQSQKRISSAQAQIDCLIAKSIKKRYQTQKQTIQLQCLQLTTQNCSKLLKLGSKQQRKNIKQLQLLLNVMVKVPFQPEDFPNLVALNLGRNPFSQIKDLRSLSFLTSLSLDKCNLTCIPSFIFEMPQMAKLRFYKNDIVEIPDQIGKLINLIDLNFEGCQIETISSKIKQCSKLQMLSLQRNNLKVVIPQLCELPHLKQFIIYDNKIKQLPQNLGNLISLKQLRFNGNQEIKIIPQSIVKLTDLNIISLANTQIQDFALLTSLHSLQNLIIQNTKIKMIPNNFESLTNLINLKINNVAECKLKDKLDKMIGLQTIQIQNSNLVSLSRNLHLQDLKEVTISFCAQLIMEKETFTSLNSLLSLNLNNCKLKIFPQLADCLKLYNLNLSHNLIEFIPNLSHLTDLKIINLSFNRLTQLDYSLVKLKRLTNLQLQNNKIDQIINFDQQNQNKSITSTELCITSNHLTSVPSQLIQFKRLTKFDITFNPITQIVYQLAKLTELSELTVNSFNTVQSQTNLKSYIEKNKQNYIIIPTITDPTCHLCSKKIAYPFYWLKWQQGNDDKYGCRECIQTAPTDPTKDYNYQKNSILLFSDRRQLIRAKLVGKNIQPTDPLNKQPNNKYICNNCKTSSFKLGIARYICLHCGERDDNLSDLCQNCWKQSLVEDKRKDIEAKLNSLHQSDHPWIRTLYQSISYRDY